MNKATNTKDKKEKFQPQLLSQCPGCRAVLMTMADGRARYQQSVVVFEKLPKEPCYECKLKAENKEKL